MEENKKKTTNPMSYHIGQVFAALTAACIMALMVAMTVKVIVWMF